MYSSLTSGTIWSPNCNHPRNDSVRKITIHHMAAPWTAQRCGEAFADPNRQGSSNYGIGMDGEIYCYVDEDDRAWTSGSPWNDHQAITIECANDVYGENWHVSDATLESCIKLCVDICQRYGFRLEWTGDANGSLTVHRFYQNTSCPGEYLFGLMPWIAEEVNRRLDGVEPSTPDVEPSVDPEPTPVVYGSSISEVQQWLNDNYGTGLDVDGIYGGQTQRGLVVAFQNITGCEVDGIFGNECRGAASANLLQQGSQGNLVYVWQGALICLGYDPNGFDGDFGGGCAEATRTFQANCGLDVDGIVGGDTFYTALTRFNTESYEAPVVEEVVEEQPVEEDPVVEEAPAEEETVVEEVPSYSDDLVAQGQQWLNDTYGFGIAVDGYWGNETKGALTRAFQIETGCGVDGIWGDECRNAAANYVFTVDKTGALVGVWQAALCCRDYNPNGIDNIFGGGCLTATINFQVDCSIGADGWVGVDTWQAMLG